MLVVGAGGFAKEILSLLKTLDYTDKIAFFDNINLEKKCLFGKYPVLNADDQVKAFFLENQNFILGVGTPKLRRFFFNMFTGLGGLATTVVSKQAFIGTEDVFIGEGATIMHGAVVSNSSSIGMGCLLYFNSVVAHDCQVGDFVEISPGAKVLGRCKIGNNVSIGANATILPDVKLGDGVIVGAGAVVTRTFEEKCVIAGVPAKKIK